VRESAAGPKPVNFLFRITQGTTHARTQPVRGSERLGPGESAHPIAIPVLGWGTGPGHLSLDHLVGGEWCQWELSPPAEERRRTTPLC
jgi:hypothetical protein